MIVENSSTPIIRSGLSTESLFNIKQENVAHIFSILRNQLYSDKILAVIREYSTNAMDAHIEGNVDRPFEITLPTAFSPEFIVRDFGAGLSPEEIVEIFASYGESTKRSSNSFTGMLGLGSKSAFAYTNTFLIKSRHNGIQYTYSAFIDETNVGVISLIDTEPTDESGLSVHINVKPQDCRLFEERCKSFFQYCTMMPKFINNTSVLQSITEKPSKSVMEGSDWKITSESNELILHMGNVPYIITRNNVMEFIQPSDQETVGKFLHYRSYLYGTWHIFAPIGSVKPSASRESLEFDEKTKLFIGKKIASICQEILDRTNSELIKKKSDWERRVYANEMLRLFSFDSKELKLFALPYEAKDLAPLGIHKVRVERSNNKFSDEITLTLSPSQHTILFLDSPDITRVSVRPRVNEYVEKNNITSQPYYSYSQRDGKALKIICFKTKEDKDKFKNNPNFLGAEMVDLADVPYTPSKKSNSNSLKGEVGELFTFHPDQIYNLKKWKATKDRPEKIVWVEISNFMPKEYNKDNQKLQHILDAIGNCFLSLSENVVLYGVKSANVKDVGEDWIELTEYFKMKVEQFKKKHKVEYDAYCRFNEMPVFWKCFIEGDFQYRRQEFRGEFDPKKITIPSHLYEPFKPLYLEFCLYRYNESKMSTIQSFAHTLGLKFYEEQRVEEIKQLVKDIPILEVFQYASVPFEDLHKKITELL